MKKLLIIGLILLGVSQVFAQDHQFSSVPESARYEIVQSSHGARYTFLLNKKYGTVSQMVKGDNGITWQSIYVERHPNNEFDDKEVNYQIFMSGHGDRYTILLNIHNGNTWQLVLNSEDKNELFFKPKI